MNLRSRGQENLIELVQDIERLERMNTWARREDYYRAEMGYGDYGDQEYREIQALNEKLDKVLQATQRQINYVGEFDGVQGYQEIGMEDSRERYGDVKFFGGQGGYQGGFNPNYRDYPNFSYRSTNVENPQNQVYPSNQRSHQEFQGGQGAYQDRPSYNSNYQQGYQGYEHQEFQRGQSAYQGRPSYNSNYQQGYQGYQQQGQSNSSPQQDPYMKTMQAMLQQALAGQASAASKIDKRIDEIHTRVDQFHNNLNAKFEGLSSHFKQLDHQLAQKAWEPNQKEYISAITLRSGRELPEREHVVESRHEENKVVVEAEKDEAVQKEAEKRLAPKLVEPKFVPPPYESKLPFPGRFKKQLVKKYRAISTNR